MRVRCLPLREMRFRAFLDKRFFHLNSNSTENSFWAVPYSRNVIALKLCTWAPECSVDIGVKRCQTLCITAICTCDIHIMKPWFCQMHLASQFLTVYGHDSFVILAVILNLQFSFQFALVDAHSVMAHALQFWILWQGFIVCRALCK